jgi:uncharacterized protein
MKRNSALGELKIFDAHTHFFSHQFFTTLVNQSPKLSQERDPHTSVAALTGWTMPASNPAEFAAQWKQELDQSHVSTALMLASVPGDEESIAAAVNAFPERIIGGFMFDPTKPNVEARIHRAFDDDKLKVAALFPAMHHYAIAENEGIRTVVAIAAETPSTAVFVHCGILSVGVRKKLGLPSKFDLRFGNPLDIYKLAVEFPTTNFIVPHFGAGMFREALMLADLCPNVYLDTSSSNQWMKYDGLDLATVFKRSINIVGHERLLFGTDSSFFPRGWNTEIFDAQVSALAEIGVSHEQAAAIFGGNLRRLLIGDSH